MRGRLTGAFVVVILVGALAISFAGCESSSSPGGKGEPTAGGATAEGAPTTKPGDPTEPKPSPKDHLGPLLDAFAPAGYYYGKLDDQRRGELNDHLMSAARAFALERAQADAVGVGDAERCATLWDSQDVGRCRLEVMGALVEETGDPTRCAELKDSNRREACRENLTRALAIERARTTGDASVCEEIKSPGDRRRCLDGVLSAKPGEPTTLPICALLEGEGEAAACVDQQIEAVREDGLAQLNCEALEDEALATRCRDKVHARLSLLTESVKACDKISDEHEKKRCQNVANSAIAEKTQDPERCLRIKDDKLRQSCVAGTALSVSRERGDASQCRYIKDPMMRGECEYTAAVMQAMLTADTEACLVLENKDEITRCREEARRPRTGPLPFYTSCDYYTTDERPACYQREISLHAWRTLDPSWCRGLKDEFEKSHCQREVARAAAARLEDEAACALPGGGVNQDCVQAVRAYVAGLAGDDGICEQGGMSATCSIYVAAGAAVAKGEVTPCQELKSETRRHECLRVAAPRVAEEQDLPQVCMAFEEDEAARDCLSRRAHVLVSGDVVDGTWDKSKDERLTKLTYDIFHYHNALAKPGEGRCGDIRERRLRERCLEVNHTVQGVSLKDTRWCTDLGFEPSRLRCLAAVLTGASTTAIPVHQEYKSKTRAPSKPKPEPEADPDPDPSPN
jgi:hypothetical protein